MAAACALAIFSGRIILNFGFQESLRTFLKPIFTGGVVETNGSFSAAFCESAALRESAASLRPHPALRATFPRPGEGFSGSGTVSGVAGGGNYKLQSKTVAPIKSQQAITPDSGYYGLSDVTVSQIPDAYQDVSSVTAGAADTLTGKVLVTADGKVTTGTMLLGRMWRQMRGPLVTPSARAAFT